MSVEHRLWYVPLNVLSLVSCVLQCINGFAHSAHAYTHTSSHIQTRSLTHTHRHPMSKYVNTYRLNFLHVSAGAGSSVSVSLSMLFLLLATAGILVDYFFFFFFHTLLLFWFSVAFCSRLLADIHLDAMLCCLRRLLLLPFVRFFAVVHSLHAIVSTTTKKLSLCA